MKEEEPQKNNTKLTAYYIVIGLGGCILGGFALYSSIFWPPFMGTINDHFGFAVSFLFTIFLFFGGIAAIVLGALCLHENIEEILTKK
jgi:hypothetical protein